ncbi:endolytic transglycosylase MltG [Roseospira visakhapatnamensis]|uniref:Endolytic murein transglycosylase n=1 Tax=Roseospira visakhapatnamensis TaxID=390880 RepID=A0A7W6RBD5_9PROT|nr:endolytic transglycosylase MltG [Roseospira visakhapatnamensis]MBB4265305.1 UPF0755 protein [Roseospira visakhapatnamensis]
MIQRLFTLLLVLVGVAVVAGYAGYRYVLEEFASPGPLAQPVTVVVPVGTGLPAIARRLADAGVVDEPLIFEVGVRLADQARALKAGEYQFPASVSPREAMDMLAEGAVVARKVTVAEGLTTRRVLDLVRRTSGLSGDLSLTPGEGEVLPETYHFALGDSRDAVVQRMMDAMDETLATLWPARADGLPIRTPRQAVILASIVERETGRPEERAHVAGVFINRLRKGMRLQSDPTVIYGLDPSGSLGRGLTRRDLRTETPYNTYVIAGLPPGPICNPGRDALAAVLNPLKTKDLYFVADGTGGHAFAATLAEHNRNVARWRRFQREQGLR